MITFRRLGHLGRWGNQLFQYAGTRLYAHLNGFSCAMPPWLGVEVFSDVAPWKGMQKFKALVVPTLQLADFGATTWPERFQRPLGRWSRGDMGKLWEHPRDNLNLYGYVQDPVTLAKLRQHRNLVRSWFRFRPEIERALRTAT